MRKRNIIESHRFRWVRGIVLLLTLLAILLSDYTATASLPPADAEPDSATPAHCVSAPPCVGFEGLTLGTTYHVGDSFVDAGVLITAQPFVWSSGTPTSNGYAQVGNAGLAGGSGLEMQVNNINLAFDFGQPLLYGLSLDFGEYGGNLNIDVNGDFRNFENFVDIHGLVIGGVKVIVVNGLGNDTGRLFLFGPIQSFFVGGQELWIDDVCPQACCVRFESLPLGAVYHVGGGFFDVCAHVSVQPFFWSDGTPTSSGYAQVGNAGLAGGAGLEMQVNNVNLAFDFGQPLVGLSLNFGEYGGNLNIEINGDFRNFENFADINGFVIGGVKVFVVNGWGNDQGHLGLTGIIHQFSVGGQELWIDDVCPELGYRVFLPIVLNNAS
jgi:hypothetical protein